MVGGWDSVWAGSPLIAPCTATCAPPVSPWHNLRGPVTSSVAVVFVCCRLPVLPACAFPLFFRYFCCFVCVCSEKTKTTCVFFLSISSRMIPGEKKQKTLLHRFHASAAADEPTRASKRPATHATPPVLQPTRLASSPAREGLPS